MPKLWIVRRGAKVSAPVTSEKLVQLAKKGTLRPDDLIRPEGQVEWHAAREVKGLFREDSASTSRMQPTPTDAPEAATVEPMRARPSSIVGTSHAPPQPQTPYPPLPPSSARPVPTVNVVMPKGASSLGIASMVLGILAILICWIPFVGIIGLPLSGLGLLLGIIGLIVALKRQGSGIGYPIAGSAIAGLALFIGMLQCAAIVGTATAITEAVSESDMTNQEVVSATLSPPPIESADGSAASSTEKYASPDAGVRAAGHQFAKKLITPALKAPASADFPWDSVTFSKMEPLTDKSGATAQRWLVRGAVDAPNSFGAQIRSNWQVVVLATDDTFFPGEARLGNEVVFQMESYRAMNETPNP